MTEEKAQPQEQAVAGEENAAKEERFPELAELEEEIQSRIRSNQRFLERFMDDDFEDVDEEGELDAEEDPANFEEL